MSRPDVVRASIARPPRVRRLSHPPGRRVEGPLIPGRRTHEGEGSCWMSPGVAGLAVDHTPLWPSVREIIGAAAPEVLGYSTGTLRARVTPRAITSAAALTTGPPPTGTRAYPAARQVKTPHHPALNPHRRSSAEQGRPLPSGSIPQAMPPGAFTTFGDLISAIRVFIGLQRTFRTTSWSNTVQPWPPGETRQTRGRRRAQKGSHHRRRCTA
jgi:hypothetical protein